MLTNMTLLIIALIGLLDTAYLTWQRYQSFSLTCGILEGCNQVTASVYSVFGGMPVAIWGLFYYLTAVTIAGIYWKNKDITWLKLLALLTSLGFLVSLWFTYLQTAVIGAFCSYCLISALVSTLLFGISLFQLSKGTKISKVH